MAKKASLKEVEALHALLAKYYSDALESGEELSSGTLAAINTFLKNNDVTVDVMESEPLQNLSYKIRDLISEEA
jgi:hypothetical protein